MSIAQRLDAGVAKALLDKAAVPDDLPFVTGSIGWLGTYASNEMMKACDTLLIVGSQFPYTEFLPKPGQARAVQIDLDGKALGGRYTTEVNLIGERANLAPTAAALGIKGYRTLPRAHPRSDQQSRVDNEQTAHGERTH